MNTAARARARAQALWRDERDRVLLAAAALSLAASFLNPGLNVEQTLVDHVVVLDITQSMNVTDQQLAGQPVSRLAFAKQSLQQALPQLPCGSRLGWAVFTEYRAFLLVAPVEVCAHLGELQATLAGIDGRMAWAGNSEVAKGLHSAITVAKQLPDKPSLVFVTDGHEAPPLNPRHRPAFDDKPGDVAGLLVGVGGPLPAPIPKTDALGRPLGFWRADEVMQTDRYSQGRGASLGREKLVDDDAAGAALPRDMPRVAPGSEHLSSLHEGYLRLLAGELGLTYHHLQTGDALAEALTADALARPVLARAELRPLFAALAALLLLARLAPVLLQRLRQLRRGHG